MLTAFAALARLNLTCSRTIQSSSSAQESLELLWAAGCEQISGVINSESSNASRPLEAHGMPTSTREWPVTCMELSLTVHDKALTVN